MEPVYSSKKRKKRALESESVSDPYTPMLVTPTAQAKYVHMRPNLTPGISTSFHSFPALLQKITDLGWGCLITFPDRHIYPSLIAEFYTHMTFVRNSSGILTSIHTCIQGQNYVIDELLILHALHLRNCMFDLSKINEYPHLIRVSTSDCITFKHNLAITSEQLVPANLFDFPCPIGPDYLTAQCQFLSKLFRQNFMPVRKDKLMHPFDLELMKCILTECMPYSLPYFLLTSFEFCYYNNCLGYGLILTSIFKHLGIPVFDHKTEVVPTSNIISHLHLPPKPLTIFSPDDTEPIHTQLNLISQIATLHSMNQLCLKNLSSMLSHIESLQTSVHHLRDMLYVLMEHQTVSIPPYNFMASTSSPKGDPTDQTPPAIPLPSMGLQFSSVSLEDF